MRFNSLNSTLRLRNLAPKGRKFLDFSWNVIFFTTWWISCTIPIVGCMVWAIIMEIIYLFSKEFNDLQDKLRCHFEIFNDIDILMSVSLFVVCPINLFILWLFDIVKFTP